MEARAWILISLAAMVVAFAFTGVWRIILWPLRIRPQKMSAERLGFRVSDGADRNAVDGVCRAFAMGFNSMISHPSPNRWHAICDEISPMYRPFAYEGAAMGFPLRSLMRFSARVFERDIVALHSQFAYLHYVGLGFWSGMRNHDPERIERVIADLDPLLGDLCWDGYGFQHGFFDFDDTDSYTRKFGRLRGYSRHVAHQGLGRSLWFRFMGDPDGLIAAIRSLGPMAGDAAAGLGLAAVFANADRPQRGLEVVSRFPLVWHRDVQLGMCFGYKARARCDAAFFDEFLNKLDAPRARAVRAAVVRCDAIEVEVRRSVRGDGYRHWREALRDWLAESVSYPFAALRSEERKQATEAVNAHVAN